MSRYRTITTTADLSDDNISAVMAPVATDEMVMYVDKIILSVHTGSDGDEGIIEILGSDGGFVWRVNVGTVKEKSFEFGERGTKVGKYVGLQALLSGASDQAGVSVAVVYHLDTED